MLIQLSRDGKTMIENTTRVDKKLILIDADFTSFLHVYNRVQIVIRDGTCTRGRRSGYGTRYSSVK